MRHIEAGNMPRIFPDWEEIDSFQPPLNAGARALAEFLDSSLPDEWEIFIKPYMNGDRPDIVIFHPQIGVQIFEVKDWQAERYRSEDGQFFAQDRQGEWQRIASPISQVERYRNNLTNLYVPELGQAIDQNSKVLACVQVALYFHEITTAQAKQLVPNAKYNVFGHDSLDRKHLVNVAPQSKLTSSAFMKEEWAQGIRTWLQPPFHAIEPTKSLPLNKDQKRYAKPKSYKHQLLYGAAGSGKTLVLAQRAANLAAQGKRVLVLTYNVTLWHYVRDFISRARQTFRWEYIELKHFHGFCSEYLMENDIAWPQGKPEEIFARVVPELVIESIRANKNKKHRAYDAILIDEGQDFQELWYTMLTQFLTENDELLMVVDQRQNLYRTDLSWLKEQKRFKNNQFVLTVSYRLPRLILEQVNKFADEFLPFRTDSAILPANYDRRLFENYVWRNVRFFGEAKEKTIAAVDFLLAQRVQPSDIAILVPDQLRGMELVKAFEDKNVPVDHVFEDENRYRHKTSFWMADGRLKISTVHSFKGWEIPNVIIITPFMEHKSEVSLDFILYTAITRAQDNLIVFNQHPRYRRYGEGWLKHWQ
jgi:thymidine kinase